MCGRNRGICAMAAGAFGLGVLLAICCSLNFALFIAALLIVILAISRCC
jgi:hypothetical protein